MQTQTAYLQRIDELKIFVLVLEIKIFNAILYFWDIIYYVFSKGQKHGTLDINI